MVQYSDTDCNHQYLGVHFQRNLQADISKTTFLIYISLIAFNNNEQFFASVMA